ncbi:hypothetical protein [Moorena sp. SIO4G3]|uniref:hypothetical protein n=1 Tax=Moorena sp. SIO4G3 TaxID=2607821 RepID=UPI00142C21D1|nr:hypothetical protein [Moorena sp. SIO4G3]NEO81379.1 hypothetical protein [Moorena sp. SIO4G3]
MQKNFSDSVYVNSCPLFPVPCSRLLQEVYSTLNLILRGRYIIVKASGMLKGNATPAEQ